MQVWNRGVSVFLDGKKRGKRQKGKKTEKKNNNGKGGSLWHARHGFTGYTVERVAKRYVLLRACNSWTLTLWGTSYFIVQFEQKFNDISQGLPKRCSFLVNSTLP